MTANAFRRGPWPLFGLVVGIVYGALLTVLVVGSLMGARAASDVELVRSIVVIGGSLTLAGFVILPLVFGSDDSMDPRAFGLFGISNARLAKALSVAALATIPVLVVAICSVATIVTWSRNPGSTILAIISAALAVVTCALTARITTSLAAFAFATRRARTFGTVITVLIIVVIAPIALLLVNIDWGSSGLVALQRLASWLSWTPLGAVWSVPADAALGQTFAPLLKLLIALAFIGVLWVIWRALVARMLVTPQRSLPPKVSAPLAWFAAMPHSPTGAIAARSLTYWARDRRYWMSLVMIPLVPIVAVAALLIAGVSGHIVALLPLPLVCLFLGWTIHNDVAYDSTAVWLHVASGARGVADRVGRLIPVVLIGIPVVAIGSVITTAFYGDWLVMPAVIGVSTAVLLIGVGLSSVSSALLPYPATKPNDSAFAGPQNTGAAPAVIQSLSFVAIIVLSSPVVALGILGITDSAGWFMQTLYAGLALGVCVLVGGVLAGAAAFNRRGPEIMAAAIRAD